MKFMNINMKRFIFISAFMGAVLVPGSAITAHAQESTEPIAGIETVLKEASRTKVMRGMNLYMVENEEGEYFNMAFSNADDVVYIKNAPHESADWLGKLYPGNMAEVQGTLDGWVKIKSGSVEGYVKEEELLTGKAAKEHDSQITMKATVTGDSLDVYETMESGSSVIDQIEYGEEYILTGEESDNWYQADVEGTSGWVNGEYINIEKNYEYAESWQEEEERIAQEAQKAEEEAAQEKGKEIIDFATGFIGNPYVWGGTSLTDGADCSGYVQAVYAEFGISLPRTTWDMEAAGVPVNVEEALPGDIFLYEGHVGLYMGDGTIVNALNSSSGITITDAFYQPVKTVRRVI